MSARGGEIYKSLTAALEEVAGVWEGLKVRTQARSNSPRTVQDVVYALPLVLDAHFIERAALVVKLGSAPARQLHDQHSQRWYCCLI